MKSNYGRTGGEISLKMAESGVFVAQEASETGLDRNWPRPRKAERVYSSGFYSKPKSKAAR